MKFLFSFLLVFFFSFQAPAAEMCVQDEVINGGDATPWPWGSELRFPWQRIQGVWAPVMGECDSYFMFKVSSISPNGERIVQVTQYDPETCKHIATGVGFENDRVIHASMSSATKSFDLTIRAFDTSAIRGQADLLRTTSSAKSTIVLSVYPRKSWEKRRSFEMQKIVSNPNLICRE